MMNRSRMSKEKKMMYLSRNIIVIIASAIIGYLASQFQVNSFVFATFLLPFIIIALFSYDDSKTALELKKKQFLLEKEREEQENQEELEEEEE